MRASIAPILLALALLVPVASAHGPFVESDPAATLGLFPTHAEVESLVERADEHPWVTLHAISASGSGRSLRLLEITNPDSPVPMEDRIVTLLLTQQHGNEPAGTGAAYQLLEDFLGSGALSDALDNQVLLLMPMANPDGAEAGARTNKDGVDINRDHVALESVEARAIHAVLTRWDVHVAMDHHEYGGTGVGNPVPVRMYDFDLTTLFPRHGNVRAPTQTASEELMYDVLWPAAEAEGYTVGEYGVQTVAGVPVQQLAGGPDPGILRNNFGLNNVAGLLIETRVDAHPNPFHDAQRRIDIQRLVMETTLQHASENAERFIEAKRESERLSLVEPAQRYVEGDLTGAMPQAFVVRESLDALFALHGLPPGVQGEGGWVYDLRHERQGLAAAILHPASSRAVAEATPLTQLPEDITPLAEDAAERVPGPGAAAALLALGLAFVLRRR